MIWSKNFIAYFKKSFQWSWNHVVITYCNYFSSVFELAIILYYILQTVSTQTDQPPDTEIQLLVQGKGSHECCVNNGYMCYDLVNRSKKCLS